MNAPDSPPTETRPILTARDVLTAYYPLMLRTARGTQFKEDPRFDPEDVAQEAAVRMLRTDSFDPARHDPRRWAAAVTRRASVDLARRVLHLKQKKAGSGSCVRKPELSLSGSPDSAGWAADPNPNPARARRRTTSGTGTRSNSG